jgi:hypothetical protein
MALVDSTQQYPTFSTTDTFQQLINRLNEGFPLVDSDLKYLDARIGDLSELTTTQESLVKAINELDSDLFGAGGGSAATELVGSEKTIVDALNLLTTMFDPDFNGFVGRVDSDFAIVADGHASLLLQSDSDIVIEAGRDSGTGDIYLSTQEKIVFQKNNTDRLTFTFNDSGNTLTSEGLYKLDAQDSVVFMSGANSFSLNNVIDYKLLSDGVHSTIYGDLNQNIDGQYNINLIADSDVETLKIERSGGHYFKVDLDRGLSAGSQVTVLETNEPMRLVSNSIELKTTEMVAETNFITLQDPSNLVYGGLVNNGGFLTIQNQDSDALRFSTLGPNQRDAEFTGSISLPATGHGSPSGFPGGMIRLHEMLQALDRKIPKVYDKNGTLLNPLV